MVSLEAFSDLLHVLYSAPLQQEQWQRFLTRVCEHTASSLGVFIAADTSAGLAILASGGTGDNSEIALAYNRDYAHRDPFRPAVVRRCRQQDPVAVYSEDELIPSGEFLRSEIYRELLEPASLRYAAITILACSVRALDAISLWRTPEEGPISPDSRRLLELLIPHVQTALAVHRALGAAEARQACAEAMVNASPTAMLVLTRDGRVRHSNTAAESLLRTSGVLRLADGCLTSDSPKVRANLTTLCEDAVSPCYSLTRSTSTHALSLRRDSGKRPLQLLAVALPDLHREKTRADLLLLVSDPDQPARFPDDLLHALYGFTPAEVEVANALLMGYSAEEIGCLRRVSAGTVRQQLKSMLGKTGTNRQSEMVRLFMMLPRLPAQSA